MKEINLEEILYAFCNSENAITKSNVPFVLNAMKEACEQVLELAAENSECKLKNKIECTNFELERGFVFGSNAIIVNKQSIMDTINQVK